MKIRFLITLVTFFTLACDHRSDVINDSVKHKFKRRMNMLDINHHVIASKKLESGIVIKWFQKGKGEKLDLGDLVMIDFKVRLLNGKVVDGNHLIKKKMLPFLVGFGLQTSGWDIALKELKVGDFVRIYLPSELARGQKGIKGWIPSNSDNNIDIRILNKKMPNRVVDGTKVWILEENKSNKLKFDDKTQIIFHGIASSPSKSMFANTFRTNNPISYRFGDHGLVPGLAKALKNAKKSDRLFVLVPPEDAYGSKGYLDFVKPNESVFYNIFIMDVVKK